MLDPKQIIEVNVFTKEEATEGHETKDGEKGRGWGKSRRAQTNLTSFPKKHIRSVVFLEKRKIVHKCCERAKRT